jgi:hypothetical protein
MPFMGFHRIIGGVLFFKTLNTLTPLKKVFRARSRENTVSLFWANASIIRGNPENPKIEKRNPILQFNILFKVSIEF